MPYISLEANTPILPSQAEELKTQFGKAISLIPGKSETYLMVSVKENPNLWMAGTNDGAAYIRVAMLGKAQRADCNTLTARICQVVSRILSIAPNRVYVCFSYTDEWGCDGTLF